jgi:hypothetical protein
MMKAPTMQAATNTLYPIVVSPSLVAPLLMSTCLLVGCATVPLERANSLSSYSALASSDGFLTHASVRVEKEDLLAAKTVRIVSTVFSPNASGAPLSERQRKLVANVIDRTLCIHLSDRFVVVLPAEPADLTVHAVITYVDVTDQIAAGVSSVATNASSVAASALLPVRIPVRLPRIPVGLGGLAVEAEGVNEHGEQKAAMVWARGADSFTSRPKWSSVSDAYDLAKLFADDFGTLLVKAANPMQPSLPSFSSMERVVSEMGGQHKYAACESFGRSPGLKGAVGDSLGLPPEWTDKAADGATLPQGQ